MNADCSLARSRSYSTLVVAPPISPCFRIGRAVAEFAQTRGRDFLTHFLINHPQYFVHIDVPDLAELRNSFSSEWSTLYPPNRAQDNNLKAFGELLFSNDRGGAMNDRYSIASGTPEGKGLRHSAWVFLGGMAYYIGLVVRELIADSVVKLDHIGQGDLRFRGASRNTIPPLPVRRAGRIFSTQRPLRPVHPGRGIRCRSLPGSAGAYLAAPEDGSCPGHGGSG